MIMLTVYLYSQEGVCLLLFAVAHQSEQKVKTRIMLII